jgi:RNA polymerase subunit RPABC4/transcription elongation factor Spt4
MGFPPMLNGKNKHLNSTDSVVCPKCGDEFTDYELINKINENQLNSTKNCPNCKQEIAIKNLILPKRH